MALIAKDESLENIQITTTYTTTDGRTFHEAEKEYAAMHQDRLDRIAVFCEAQGIRTTRGCSRVRKIILAWETEVPHRLLDAKFKLAMEEEDASEEVAQLEGEGVKAYYNRKACPDCDRQVDAYAPVRKWAREGGIVRVMDIDELLFSGPHTIAAVQEVTETTMEMTTRCGVMIYDRMVTTHNGRRLNELAETLSVPWYVVVYLQDCSAFWVRGMSERCSAPYPGRWIRYTGEEYLQRLRALTNAGQESPLDAIA